MIAGGAKLDCPTKTNEIYTSTLGLLVPVPTGLGIITSGHAVGEKGSPIFLADGVPIGTVTKNPYLSKGGWEGKPVPDVALSSWSGAVTGMPLVVNSSIGSTSLPLPITGYRPPTPAMPVSLMSDAGGVRLGVVLKASATVTDAQTLVKVHDVVVAKYKGDSSDAGAPVITFNLETGLPVLVGFHGGAVKVQDEAEDSLGPQSWIVPWLSAKKALSLPPLPLSPA